MTKIFKYHSTIPGQIRYTWKNRHGQKIQYCIEETVRGVYSILGCSIDWEPTDFVQIDRDLFQLSPGTTRTDLAINTFLTKGINT